LANWEAPASDPSVQRNLGGALAVSRSYAVGPHTGTVEFGGKVRDADKTRTVNDQYFTATGRPVLTVGAILGGPTDPGYYFGSYTQGPLTDINKLMNFLAANPSALALNVDQTHQRDDPNNYQTTERVYAGFLMNTLRTASSSLQTGLRLETTQSSYTGYHVTLDSSGHYLATTPLSGDRTYTNVLPSVQYRYAFDTNTNMRAVYGMGLARPNFGDLPPYILEQDRRRTISVGNPALQPTRANNFDVLFERFLEPVGAAQVGVFYKALTNPIYPNVQTPVTSGTFAGYTQSQAINGPSAHVGGIELTWQQHLSFLPGALSGLGMRTNYSYTTSKASVPGRTDNPALVRQAPNNWNVDVTYDKGALSGRAGVTHNDAYIYAYNYQPGADGGISGPNGDVYLYPHTQLDAQISYAISRRFQVVLALLNLNNEVFGFYQGSQQYPIQREFYSRTVSVGFRLTR
jgi:TonB-dependent receptor